MKATHTTSTGQRFNIRPNRTKRTFTISKLNDDGTAYAKYRTIPMTKNEFTDNLSNTGNDWMQFLKSDEYYTI